MTNDTLSNSRLSLEQKQGFRDQLRDARGAALKDAEAFTEILFVIERLGAAFVKADNKNKFNLGAYRTT
ncbi:hypothetical protein [Spirosoma agri]|uniref:Uncharacterized protein n=1 Tax=Spirosoma agri TaxID=1987381 RepID=A0A6M0IMC0_9BACT|nr:hypothetical protein [Spirosoma agri]NEU69469.1 hypothetical protein [Spirosoma agri]